MYKKDYTDFLKSFIKFSKAKTVVEIGVANGDSTIELCKTLKEINGKLFGFDIWNKHGLKNQYKQQGSLQDVLTRLKKQGLNNFVLNKIDTINNRDEFERVLDNLLENNKIDFAFIDGDHSYIGIKNDFEVVYSRLSKTGIIAFHDTLMIDGCREFMLDLKTKYFDGTYDIINFPFGCGKRLCGVSILMKRSFPNNKRKIDQIAGSLSSPKEIEERESQWLKEEKGKYSNHKKLNSRLSKEDMNEKLSLNKLMLDR